MAEYIDKNDLREYISGYIKSCNGKPTYTDMDAMVGIISLLEQMPAADVQPINRWISVEDRLPESEKDVLIWYRNTWGAGFTSYRFGISRWFSNIKRWYEGCLPKDIEVLYWQPLSEPPQD